MRNRSCSGTFLCATPKGKIVLKDGCGIGANSVIFPNVIIGKNAKIGANSLVNCNIPDNEVWAGTPAKKIH